MECCWRRRAFPQWYVFPFILTVIFFSNVLYYRFFLFSFLSSLLCLCIWVTRKQGRDSANSSVKSWIFLNFHEFTRIYLNLLEFGVFEKRLTDPRMDRRTDGRTDKASYRDAWTHLKTSESEKDVQRCLLKWPDKKHCFCDAEQNRNKILKFIHIITVCILLSF